MTAAPMGGATQFREHDHGNWRGGLIKASAIAVPFLVGCLVVSSFGLSTSYRVPTYGVVRHFPKLFGVNWMDMMDVTDRSIIQREVASMKNLGFNFIRLSAHAYRFIDWESKVFDTSRGKWSFDNLVYVMNLLKDEGFWVELVPMEPWKLGGDMKHWWTNKNFQDQISYYYRAFASWCKNMGWENIVYVTLWWEASGWFEWVDGRYVVECSLPCYDECNSDWSTWLSEHEVDPVNLTIGSIEANNDLYTEWSRTRFNEVTEIKANATHEGWPTVLTAAEMGFSYPWSGTYPTQYLQLCAKDCVDLLQIHDYQADPQRLEHYLSHVSGKYCVANELGLPPEVNATETDNAWTIIKPKLDFIVGQPGSLGFAYWCWTDYDERILGLKDRNFNPRPILSLLSGWLNDLTTTNGISYYKS